MPVLEAVGAAASIAALVQLAAKLTQTGYKYVIAVKKAPEDARELVEELKSLGGVLKILQEYSDKSPESEALRTLNGKGGPLKRCTLELEVLQKKLDPYTRKGFRGVFRSLKWPLKETETFQTISRIERLKSLFNIAVNTDNIFLSKAIKQDVDGIHFSVEEFLREYRAERAAQNARRRDEETIQKEGKRQEVLNWIFPEATETRHNEISSNRQKYTGRWLIESLELKEWADGERKASLLLGYGIPGAGKTFLSSAVIDDLIAQSRTKNIGVVYIYFNYQEQAQQTPLHILGSLVRQLAYQINKLPVEVEALYETAKKKGRRPTLEELYAALLVTFKSFDRVFLVFDALDECDPKFRGKELLPLLRRMGNDGARLFLTSRDHQDIRNSLHDVSQIRLSARGDDIKYYVQEKIDEDPNAKRLIQRGECEDKIISELTECAQGMFLLVKFHIDYLCQQTTLNQILTALKKLRTTSTANTPLDPTYDRVIESINQKPEIRKNLAVKIFTWLVTARRPLTVNEIRVAVSVEQERYELDEQDLPDQEMILEVCSSLVTIDEASDIVRLAHFTVQEYLHRKSIIHKDAETELATTCLTYLSFDIFGEGFCPCGHTVKSYSHRACSFEKTLRDPPLSHSLLRYAASCLSSQIGICDEEKTLKALLRFLKGRDNIYSYLRVLYQELESSSGFAVSERLGEHPIHIVSDLGHFLATRKLLEEGVSVLALDERGRTALFSAASAGHEAMARLLIEKGADVSVVDSRGETALFEAARGGHEAVVQFLIEKGANVSAVDEDGETVLFWPAFRGHEAVVRVLVEKGADVSVVDNSGETALFEAAREGHEAVVRFLVEKGADVSVVDKRGETALFEAAHGGHEAVVRFLVEKGADVSVVDKRGETALFEAAHRGHEAVVRFLVEKGADVSVVDIVGKTALFKAARGGHEAVVRFLVEKGADVSVVDKRGETALFEAARRGHEAVVRFLVEKGADVSVVDNGGETALFKAARGGHEAVVRFLVEKGADVSVVNNGWKTALFEAARGGHEAVVRFLVEKGADVSVVDTGGKTALFKAAHRGHEAVVRFLVEKGADVSVVDNGGETALFKAARGGHEAVVRFLVEKGADVSVVDNGGETALFKAAREGHEAVARFLVEKGADVSVVDNLGRTALYWAEYFGSSCVQFLREQEAKRAEAQQI